jgi:hypothetical protein
MIDLPAGQSSVRRFATITFLPRDSGEGGPPEGWWKGRGTQSERRQFKEISAPTLIALRRQRRGESSAPSTTVRSLRELQWSPSPTIVGAESVAGFRFIRIVSSCTNKGRRSADRRNCPIHAARTDFVIRSRSGRGRAYGRARLPALRRGSCIGERTPPLSPRPRFLGLG